MTGSTRLFHNSKMHSRILTSKQFQIWSLQHSHYEGTTRSEHPLLLSGVDTLWQIQFQRGFYIAEVGEKGADVKHSAWANATSHIMYNLATHKVLVQTTSRSFKLSSWTRELEVICTDGDQEIEHSSRYDLKQSWLKLSKPNEKITKTSRTGISEQISQRNNRTYHYMKIFCVGRDKR